MDRQQWRLVVPRSLRWYADLLAVDLVAFAVALTVFVPGIGDSPVWIFLGLPFALFAPGYAFVAFLYPERGASNERDHGASRSGIDSLERAVMSFGASLAIVPLAGLALSLTPMRISRSSTILGLTTLVFVLSVVAAIRRSRLAPAERFSAALPELPPLALSGGSSSRPWSARLLPVLALTVFLVTTGSVGYALTGANAGESFTELSLLSGTADGTLVADGYPTTLTVGQPSSVVLDIENHERTTQSYAVVVELQRLANDSGAVVEQQELQRFQTQVADGDRERNQITVTPSMTGDRLRLVFLLYKGAPPAEPTLENAYREVHYWVTVRPQ